MVICESLILVCTLVGKLSIGTILRSKGSILEHFGGFQAKRRKVNPRTKSQLVFNPNFGASKSQRPSPENEAQENSGRLTEKPKSQPWSTPMVKVKVKVKVNLVIHKSAPHIIKDHTRFGEVTC